MTTVAANKKGPPHVMLSYWDCEVLATYIHGYLKKKLKQPIWIDKADLKGSSVSNGTADGVENCCVFVCLLTPAYQETIDCKQQMSYAANLRKPIIPCVVGNRNRFDNPEEDEDEENDDEWSSTDWLALLVSDLAGVSFEDVDKTNVDLRCEELVKKIQNVMPK